MRFRSHGVLSTVAMAVVAMLATGSVARQHEVQFVFLSDAHYGISRESFRGSSNVDARVVNQALVASINRLPTRTFAHDGGIKSGQRVGAIDFIVVGGDVANREEIGESGAIQSARMSWAQFTADYVNGLKPLNRDGRRSALFVVPGNHEASNAIGFYLPMSPKTDRSAIAAIYNRMMAPAVPRTAASYDYATDKVWTTRDFGGVHFMFLTVWPDTPTRAWIDRDLRRIGRSTPVVMFAHDQPDVESKHLTNPNGSHDINEHDRFENLLGDLFADGTTVEEPSLVEQGALEDFLRQHPNITAYFHGNSNWNEFYDWSGPRHTIALHTFRVDSPMKGHLSATDETKLSFQVATVDTTSFRMTVRECLWNAYPNDPMGPLSWGDSKTVELLPRWSSTAVN